MTEPLYVRQVTAEEAENCDVLVCILWTDPSMMPDNLKGICCDCGQAVQHRPDAPKRPPKVCVQCMNFRLATPAGQA